VNILFSEVFDQVMNDVECALQDYIRRTFPSDVDDDLFVNWVAQSGDYHDRSMGGIQETILRNKQMKLEGMKRMTKAFLER
jgi:hypothetical protein